jgi:proline iminopeptidase
MKAKIRNTEIFFDIAGMQVTPIDDKLIEKPVLFLIHGGPGGNHVRFKYDVLKLQEVAQLVFIDQRGCGFSKKAKASECTLENNIDDIEALRKYLGLERICVLGVSYGGMVAQGYAIKYGKYVDKLILSVTAPSYHFFDEAKAYVKKFGTPEQIAICEKFLWQGKFRNEADLAKYFELMDPLYFYKKPRRKKPSTKYLKTLRMNNDTAHEVLNAGFGGFLHHFNFIPKLKKITCPTLILAGKNDWICSPNQARIMAKHIKKATLKIFNRCGHIIAYDANAKYIKAVKEFLTAK